MLAGRWGALFERRDPAVVSRSGLSGMSVADLPASPWAMRPPGAGRGRGASVLADRVAGPERHGAVRPDLEGSLRVIHLGLGRAPLDTGTPDGLLDAGEYGRAVEKRTGMRVAFPEKAAWRGGFISDIRLRSLAAKQHESGYGRYPVSLIGQ